MYGPVPKLPKLLVAAAFAVAALGATPLAEAGLGIPQGPSAAASADYPPGPSQWRWELNQSEAGISPDGQPSVRWPAENH